MSNTYHITTAIPYVNAKPHLGHVLEWFQADSVARYQRLIGKDVSFTSGADENSLKNVQAAEKAGVVVQDWLDQYAQIFKDAYTHFGIELTGFGRGSDQHHHWPGVQKLWQLCDHAGDIYKKTYKGLYCVGCEAFYTADELVDGKCPEHLVPPEEIEEENYFFKLSKYQSQIENLIATDQLHIVSDQYKNEMLGFIRQGLQDFSVSRSHQRGRGIGVPVPGDESQVMYVWFDALAIYMTAIGWGWDQEQWQKYWTQDGEITHVIGKGINRFHSVYWIGMLLSAGLALPKKISVHGYITANGQKMSKSLGNVIDPFEVVEKYGLEPVRFYLLKYIPSHADGDFSYDKFAEIYTADLANGLGNLCSRVAKLCEKADVPSPFFTREKNDDYQLNFLKEESFSRAFHEIELSEALNNIWADIAAADQFLSEQQPWKQTGEAQAQTLTTAIEKIVRIATQLQPFMPSTAKTILSHFTQEKITALSPLFPRLAE
ncbi:MAG TPA: methionine--tRNA ligase [Vitreimonas sp.]|nr:methionine--tRNA ligase [Vitreimonas sp.]